MKDNRREYYLHLRETIDHCEQKANFGKNDVLMSTLKY